MGARSDQVKGKAKQAAGIITGDKNLEAEGKADRRSGEVKKQVEHVKGKVEDVLDTVDKNVGAVLDKVKAALTRHG